MQRAQLSRSRKLTLAVCVFAVPFAFFVAVFQGYRYKELQFSVNTLLQTQESRFESNKRAIATISVLSAPDRIDALAKQDPTLREHFPDSITYVAAPAVPSQDATTGNQTPGSNGSGSAADSSPPATTGQPADSNGSGGSR